jgi:hypothetical protein
MKIKVTSQGTSDWESAVRIVRDKYRRAFEAEVQPTPDRFVVCFARGVDQAKSNAMACAGITFGATRSLFSECYLNQPAHLAIQDADGLDALPRDSVVEIGSLASSGRFAGTELVRALPLLCWCLGKRYILCTATHPLRKLFGQVGIEFVTLCRADPERLNERDRIAWGAYYAQDPETGYIGLAKMLGQFARHTGRYSFFNPVIELAEPTHSREADYALA